MKEIETATGQIGNYLSRIRPQYERRRFERRKCNFLARLLFTLKGCRNITQYIVGVEDISEVGVRVATDHGKDIPRFFYLFVGKYQHGIGCFVVGREKGILRCEFIRRSRPEWSISSLASPTRTRRSAN